MEKVIHGHEILNLLKENNFKSIEELKLVIDKKFGEVKFTNCTKKIYSFDEIIEFFLSKEKIEINSKGVIFKPHSCSCSH